MCACARDVCIDKYMVGCFNTLLAQNLAQNKATLSALESMKKSGKTDDTTTFNWLLTYASVDLIALFRTLLTELFPGVRVCVCSHCLMSGGGAKRVLRGNAYAERRSRGRHPSSRSVPQVQIIHLHVGCGPATMAPAPPHGNPVCAAYLGSLPQ